MNLRTMIETAVDRQDARLAAKVVDIFRNKLGATYPEILARVQLYRPACSAGAWDDLLAEAEDLEAHE